MKIIIHTMHLSYSIGALLQACALGKTLEKMGNDVKLLNYVPSAFSDITKPMQKPGIGRALISYVLNKKNYEARRLNFLEFKNNFHVPLTKRYTTLDELKNDPPSADVYICGSDQVWNPVITKFDKSYFFNFGDDSVKRISYAASIGQDTVSEETAAFLRDGLKNMDAIGVREDYAVDLVGKLSKNQNVCQNIDPTFLLGKDEWKKKLREVNSSLPEKFILFYPMQESEEGYALLEALKKKTGLKCVAFTGALRKRKNIDIDLKGIGPGEFLDLLDRAEYVLTNSFHGMALSVIYRKKVMIYTKQGQNVRMESLSRLLKLERFLVADAVTLDNMEFDNVWENGYLEIEKLIEEQKENALEYLKKEISADA